MTCIEVSTPFCTCVFLFRSEEKERSREESMGKEDFVKDEDDEM